MPLIFGKTLPISDNRFNSIDISK